MASYKASPPLRITAVAPEHDAEAQGAKNDHVGHWQLLLRPDGVTSQALHHHYPGHGTAESPYVVDFLAKDPFNPMQFSGGRKWLITVLLATATLAVAFVSTAYSGGAVGVMKEFHVSSEVSILGVSLFVLGFAIGPLLWAPASEYFGRQPLFFISYAGLTIFTAGAAGAQNIETVIILRFFAGACGSSPMTNSGGVLADIFTSSERGLATAVFSTFLFLGPAVGPIASGFLGQYEGWRWVEGLMAIFTGVAWIACSLLIPETYEPALLRKRAARLSKLTGRIYISKLEVNRPPQTVLTQFAVALSRPWVLLFQEPIIFLTSIYMAIIYGTLYMMFPAFPLVYQRGRGWTAGIGGLAFIGIAVGMVLGVLYAMFDSLRYAKIDKACKGAAPPEARLPPSIVGSVLLPIGLFWFSWTNGADVHWAVSITGSGVFACGLVLVFLSLLNYLIDSYVLYAASALAANVILRSLFGTAFPLFTTYMYDDLGIHWASSIPAFLAVACLPCPVLFYWYGEKIRMRCKFASEAARVLALMRSRQLDDGEDEADGRSEDSEKHAGGRSPDVDDEKLAGTGKRRRRAPWLDEVWLRREGVTTAATR